MVAIALLAAAVLVIASLLLPETLGRACRPRDFTAAMVMGGCRFGVALLRIAAATTLQAQTSGEGCFCRPPAIDRMSERPSGPSPAKDFPD